MLGTLDTESAVDKKVQVRVPEKTNVLLRQILEATLCVSPLRRYQNLLYSEPVQAGLSDANEIREL